MALHSSYWTNSKLADWIRGTPNLASATAEGWNQWEKTAKANHPFRYWLAETALGKLQDFVTYPVRKLYDAKYYINNRWVTRTHSLTAHARDIKPGSWRDVGNRFLPCLFNELVDFVEIEQAWHLLAFDSAKRAEYNTPWYATGWFRWRVWRSADAGIEYLDWASKLTMGEYSGMDETDPLYNQPTPQAIYAKEITALYKWWTEVYHNRVDPMEASGWSAWCDRARDDNGGIFSILSDRSPEDAAESRRIMNLMNDIEKQYSDEDTEMMIRLIKVRDSLWT